MPKIKTHKTAVKRFRLSGSGKLLRRKQGGNHLRRKKVKRTIHQYSKDLPVSEADRKRVRRVLGVR